MEHFSQRLRLARQARGLSLRQLAVRSGVHYSQLSRLETALEAPSAAVQQRLSAALGVDAEKVFGVDALAYSGPEPELTADERAVLYGLLRRLLVETRDTSD